MAVMRDTSWRNATQLLNPKTIVMNDFVKIFTSPAFTMIAGTICIVVIVNVGLQTYIKLDHYEQEKDTEVRQAYKNTFWFIRERRE